MPSGMSDGFELAGAPLKTIDERFWLQEFVRWERGWKPKLNVTNRRLGDVDATALSVAGLAGNERTDSCAQCNRRRTRPCRG